MRALNQRELRLAVAFGTVIFVVANLVLLPRLRQQGRDLALERAQLEGKLLAAESWMSQQGLWSARARWLAENQPVLTPEVTPATLTQGIRDYSKRTGVEILEQNFVELPPTPAYSPTAMRLRLSGSLPAMISWLYELQQPANFILCREFSCSARDTEASGMTWDVTLARLYRPATPAAPAPAAPKS